MGEQQSRGYFVFSLVASSLLYPTLLRSAAHTRVRERVL